MKLRQSTLRTEKEQLVKEIERAVHKREANALRQLGKQKVPPSPPSSWSSDGD
jgi:hypothetical protein